MDTPKVGATRIAIVNSHPIQYFAPLYAYLHNEPSLDITALYLSNSSLRGAPDRGFGQSISWDLDLLAGYRSVFVGKAAAVRLPGGFFSLVAPEIWNEVRSGRYDVLLLHGHNYAANLIAMAAAKSVGMPILMRGETHLGLARQGLRRFLRRPLMGTFYGFCDCCLAIGSGNAAFYRAMGVPNEKIVLVPYTVDNDRFSIASRGSVVQRTDWRRQFAIPIGEIAILYAAKFSSRKRPRDLLEAARRVRARTHKPFTVVMCGSGELERELLAFCTTHSLHNVIFPGFVNQADLPKLYGACDVFVLPSENEPWGLAVNEAMCAGMPIVVSREVGCVSDLVTDGVNGFTPEAGDIDELAVALLRLVDDDELRRSQGSESLNRILHWSYRECLDGVLRAIVYLKSQARILR